MQGTRRRSADLVAEISGSGCRSANLVEPVGEQGFFAALAHAGNGEVVFFAGEQADTVIVDGAYLAERDLNAALWIVGAVEHESAGVQGELA